MGLQFEIAGNQIDGTRDYQEDAYLITHLTDAEGQSTALVIVADGMGGHAAGNVASNMVVQAINKYISANYPSDDITGLLQGGVLKANASIAETIRETPALQGMGCTMVVVLIEQDRLWWASVGDSHLYLLRDKQLIKKNADHSYGGFLDRLAAAGQAMEPEPGLSRNMLMSAVTGDEITEIDCPEEPLQLQAGDQLLICSDGMDTLSHGKIIQYAEWAEKPKAYVQALLDAVDEAAMPRQDNTTALVINMRSADVATSGQAAEQAEADDGRGDTGEMEFLDIGAGGDEPDVATDQAAAEVAESAASAAPESAPELEPKPEASPAATYAAAEPEPPRTDETPARHGPVIASAAVVVIAIIALAGYFLIWLPGEPPQPAPESTTVTEAPTSAAPPAEPEAEPAPAEPTVSEPPAATASRDADTEQSAATQKAPPKSVEITTFSDSLRGGDQGPTMARLPAGRFMMGSTRANEERPKHQVRVPAFAISQHEITIGQYARYARATGAAMPDTQGLPPDYPMFNVSWQQAANYVRWLSQQTGQNYRLPTEAEWEYAASAGRDTSYWWGITMEAGHAHCFGCSDGPPPRGPTAVGQFPANPFGLHDTEGNIAEWVQDCWHNSYDGAPETAVAWTQGGNCAQRVVRGGSWSSPPMSLRNAHRDRFSADNQYDHVGFRVARDVVSE